MAQAQGPPPVRRNHRGGARGSRRTNLGSLPAWRRGPLHGLGRTRAPDSGWVDQSRSCTRLPTLTTGLPARLPDPLGSALAAVDDEDPEMHTNRCPTPADRRSLAGPRESRVTPMGNITAIPLRGAWTGNRGRLHRGFEIVRPWASHHWLICTFGVQGDPSRAMAPQPSDLALLPRRGGRVRRRPPALCALPPKRIRRSSASSQWLRFEAEL